MRTKESLCRTERKKKGKEDGKLTYYGLDSPDSSPWNSLGLAERKEAQQQKQCRTWRQCGKQASLVLVCGLRNGGLLGEGGGLRGLRSLCGGVEVDGREEV